MLRVHVNAMYRHVLVLFHYFNLNSNSGSVGGRLHCEPQGDKLVQLLVTPANLRHHAKREDVCKATPNRHVYIAEEKVDSSDNS